METTQISLISYNWNLPPNWVGSFLLPRFLLGKLLQKGGRPVPCIFVDWLCIMSKLSTILYYNYSSTPLLPPTKVSMHKYMLCHINFTRKFFWAHAFLYILKINSDILQTNVGFLWATVHYQRQNPNPVRIIFAGICRNIMQSHLNFAWAVSRRFQFQSQASESLCTGTCAQTHAQTHDDTMMMRHEEYLLLSFRYLPQGDWCWTSFQVWRILDWWMHFFECYNWVSFLLQLFISPWSLANCAEL